jgi:dienelactone hydrolase
MHRASLALFLLAATAPALAKITTEAVPYRDGDLALEGYMAYDDSHTGPQPAVLIVHEWWGLNDFAKTQARRLAELGYVAFAVDMYGRGKVTEDPGEAQPWAVALYANPQKWRQRAKAGFDVLAGHARVDRKRIAAIGYCFGGATVQQMAWSGLPLKGVVSFHGSLVPPSTDEARRTRARVLILHGAADTHVSDEDLHKYVDALRGSNIDWQLVMYAGAKHSFTNPKADDLGMPGVGYDERAARRSWRQMRLFLAERFGQPLTIDRRSGSATSTSTSTTRVTTGFTSPQTTGPTGT